MANPAMTVVKSFTYRGTAEEWSNTYHFEDVPANDSEWHNIVIGLRTREEAILPASCTFMRFIGYDDGDGHHSPTYHEDDGATVGTYTIAGVQGPGDAASWVRWGTGRLSEKGKPVYLRKYFHAVDLVDSGPEDAFTEEYAGALGGYREEIRTGFTGFTLAGPDYSITSSDSGDAYSQWVTTRTLKRRGRRPT